MKLPFWPNPIGYRNIDLGLSRTRDLLERVGDPHKKLPPTVHVAGTNGKGSTLAFMRAILEESGRLVHCYTSPHLVEFNERIVLAGTQISDDLLNQCLLTCKNACEIEPQITPTYFEGITVAAFLAFAQTPADFLLLETGMGGRLDATNVIEKNLYSIITPISFDHNEFLGETLEEIAFEKAGIIKKNCPVFVGKQTAEVLKIIKNRAKELGCEVKTFEEDFDVEILKDCWNLLYNLKGKKTQNFNLLQIVKFLQGNNWHKKITLPLPQNLTGAHQIENAALAAFSIIAQNASFVKKNRIKSAILTASWPARLQKITSGRLFSKIPQNCQLFLDGSHNLQGAKTVDEFLKSHQNKKRILIFSMLKDKDCAGFLQQICKEIDFLITLPIKNEPKSRNADEIVIIANKLGLESAAVANFDDALDMATNLSNFSMNAKFAHKNETVILICGSLYLAGNFLEENK